MLSVYVEILGYTQSLLMQYLAPGAYEPAQRVARSIQQHTGVQNMHLRLNCSNTYLIRSTILKLGITPKAKLLLGMLCNRKFPLE